MVTIDWCKEQRKGIQLIDPSNKLSERYLGAAKETLSTIRLLGKSSNLWLATTNYYFLYFLAYALLIRVGIKCEIHECTIKVIEAFESQEYIENGFSNLLSRSKKLRVDNQYYLKNDSVLLNPDDLSTIYYNFEILLRSLSSEKVTKIRSLF